MRRLVDSVNGFTVSLPHALYCHSLCCVLIGIGVASDTCATYSDPSVSDCLIEFRWLCHQLDSSWFTGRRPPPSPPLHLCFRQSCSACAAPCRHAPQRPTRYCPGCLFFMHGRSRHHGVTAVARVQRHRRRAVNHAAVMQRPCAVSGPAPMGGGCLPIASVRLVSGAWVEWC